MPQLYITKWEQHSRCTTSGSSWHAPSHALHHQEEYLCIPEAKSECPNLTLKLGTGCCGFWVQRQKIQQLISSCNVLIADNCQLNYCRERKEREKAKKNICLLVTDRKEIMSLYDLIKTLSVPISVLLPQVRLGLQHVSTLRGWWCCTTKNSSCRWIGLLLSALFWVSNRCWRTTVFLFPDERPENPSFFQLLFMMGIFCSSAGRHQSFTP